MLYPLSYEGHVSLLQQITKKQYDKFIVHGRVSLHGPDEWNEQVVLEEYARRFTHDKVSLSDGSWTGWSNSVRYAS